MGVEELKKVLESLIRVGVKVDDVTKDGFQPLADALALVPNLTDVLVVVKNGKAAWEQYQDLDDNEQEELTSFVQEKFDIPDDKLEQVIEAWMELLFCAGDAVNKTKKALAK